MAIGLPDLQSSWQNFSAPAPLTELQHHLALGVVLEECPLHEIRHAAYIVGEVRIVLVQNGWKSFCN